MDLAPSDFWLLPQFKMTVTFHHFESIQDIKVAATEQQKAQKSSKKDGISVFKARSTWRELMAMGLLM